MCSKFDVYSCSRSWDMIVLLSTYYHTFYSPFFYFFFFFTINFFYLKLPILVFWRSRAVLQKRSNLSWWTSTFRPASPQTEGKLNLYIRFAPLPEKYTLTICRFFHRLFAAFHKLSVTSPTKVTLSWNSITQND